MTDKDVLHLIYYLRRMMEQMQKFLDEAEEQLANGQLKDKDVHKTDTGSWP